MPSAFGRGSFRASRPAAVVDVQGGITLGPEQGELDAAWRWGFALPGAIGRELRTGPSTAVFCHLFTKYLYLDGFGMTKGSILAELYALKTGCLSDKVRQTQLS